MQCSGFVAAPGCADVATWSSPQWDRPERDPDPLPVSAHGRSGCDAATSLAGREAPGIGDILPRVTSASCWQDLI